MAWSTVPQGSPISALPALFALSSSSAAASLPVNAGSLSAFIRPM